MFPRRRSGHHCAVTTALGRSADACVQRRARTILNWATLNNLHSERIGLAVSVGIGGVCPSFGFCVLMLPPFYSLLDIFFVILTMFNRVGILSIKQAI